MKMIIWSFFILLISVSSTNAQKYFTRAGKISFYSNAPLEKIEAYNNKVTSVVDITSGQIEFAVLIKAFHFEKALMQEHFNENYMESSKFPKAVFKGRIINLDEVVFAKDGIYRAQIKGQLSIHGETNDIVAQGQFTVKDKQISALSTIKVLLEDYGIKIPGVVRDNISKEIVIDIACSYKELQ